MQSITAIFTAAANGKKARFGFSLFWMMVIAIAILDDSDRREKERRDRAAAPKPKTPGCR